MPATLVMDKLQVVSLHHGRGSDLRSELERYVRAILFFDDLAHGQIVFRSIVEETGESLAIGRSRRRPFAPESDETRNISFTKCRDHVFGPLTNVGGTLARCG